MNINLIGVKQKAEIMKRNQRLLVNQVYAENNMAKNLMQSSKVLVADQNPATVSIFENNFDIWFTANEKLIDVEGIL